MTTANPHPTPPDTRFRYAIDLQCEELLAVLSLETSETGDGKRAVLSPRIVGTARIAGSDTITLRGHSAFRTNTFKLLILPTDDARPFSLEAENNVADLRLPFMTNTSYGTVAMQVEPSENSDEIKGAWRVECRTAADVVETLSDAIAEGRFSSIAIKAIFTTGLHTDYQYTSDPTEANLYLWAELPSEDFDRGNASGWLIGLSAKSQTDTSDPQRKEWDTRTSALRGQALHPKENTTNSPDEPTSPLRELITSTNAITQTLNEISKNRKTLEAYSGELASQMATLVTTGRACALLIFGLLAVTLFKW